MNYYLNLRNHKNYCFIMLIYTNFKIYLELSNNLIINSIEI